MVDLRRFGDLLASLLKGVGRVALPVAVPNGEGVHCQTLSASSHRCNGSKSRIMAQLLPSIASIMVTRERGDQCPVPACPLPDL